MEGSVKYTSHILFLLQKWNFRQPQNVFPNNVFVLMTLNPTIHLRAFSSLKDEQTQKSFWFKSQNRCLNKILPKTLSIRYTIFIPIIRNIIRRISTYNIK